MSYLNVLLQLGRKEVRMTAKHLKNVANFLTGLRLGLAVAIPLVVAVMGKQSLGGWAGALLLAAWVTDWFDGPLARKSGLAGSKFWSNADAMTDLLLSYTCFAALVVAGILAPWYLLILVAVSLLCFVDFLRVQGTAVFFLVLTYIVFAGQQNPVFLMATLLLLTLQLAFSYQRTVTLTKRFFGKQ